MQNIIDVKKFGLAVGSTIALIYIVCIIFTLLLSTETAITMANNLIHSLDISAIMRKTPMPILEASLGVVEWFIIGWLSGACIATIYNATLKSKQIVS